MIKLLQLAYKNIISKPLNLLLSIILFALGVGLINFLLLFQHQLESKFDANLASIDLVIGAKGSPLQLILCNMYHIDNPTGNVKISDAKAFLNPRHPLIKLAVPLSLGDNYKSFRIVGTSPNILTLYNAKIATGDMWNKDLEVVIGQQVADEGKLAIGDSFTSSHGFNEDEDLAHEATFKVVGILDPTGSVIDQLILTNTSSIWNVHNHEGGREADTSSEENKEEAAQIEETSNTHAGHAHEHVTAQTNEELLLHPDESITSILIQYKSKSNYQALSMPRAINENTSMQAAAPAYEINKLFSLIGVGASALQYIALLIGLVSALSIFISLYRSMKERKYELALMRVMGGSKTKLFTIVILEGLILAVIGWLIGTALSHVAMSFMAHYLKSDFRYSFDAWQWLSHEWILLGISLVIGFIAAVLPAIKASRTDIQETLSSK